MIETRKEIKECTLVSENNSKIKVYLYENSEGYLALNIYYDGNRILRLATEDVESKEKIRQTFLELSDMIKKAAEMRLFSEEEKK